MLAFTLSVDVFFRVITDDENVVIRCAIKYISEANQILLNLAKSVSKMTEDDEEDEDLQGFMTLTAVGVVIAIELAKRLMEIPKDELNDDVIDTTVEEHQMMQEEMDEDMEEDQGFEGMSMW